MRARGGRQRRQAVETSGADPRLGRTAPREPPPPRSAPRRARERGATDRSLARHASASSRSRLARRTQFRAHAWSRTGASGIDSTLAAAKLELEVASRDDRRRRGMAATSARIGFVGLGHMGGNMAERFLAAGYTVYGEERSREHAQDLIGQGLQWCDTPREVAEVADVLVTSVPDDRVLEEVASEPDGILAGVAAGKTWI